MAYIGKTPTVGNFQKCDAISVVNGQAAYTLQVGGSNVSPESPNHVLVSLNGILQAPTDSYTISGSTLTFASNLATGDVIDFVMLLGNVLDLGTPSDNTVTAAKLNNDVISGQTELAATPADTDELLISDAGTIKRIDFSHLKTSGLAMADQWRITTNVSTPSSTISDITSNWERIDTDGYGQLGSGMSESSGIFTFPSTGIYYIHAFVLFQGSSANYYNLAFFTTVDNSTYTQAVDTYTFTQDSNDYAHTSGTFIFDVTNTTTHKMKFGHRSASSGGSLQGATGDSSNAFTFMKLGDT